jgi:amino acid adenylation domain-containing protein
MTESLTSSERERLLDLLQDRMAESRDAGIPLARREESLAASYAQSRLWFLDRLEPRGSAYNVPVALRLRGTLDGPRLDRALRAVVERHEALRTTLPERDGAPVQRIGAAEDIRLERADPAEAADLPGWIAREAYRTFDLAAGPLLRAVLLPEGPDSTVLLLVAHHAVLDGWSIGLLLHELDEHYRALRSGNAVDLPELPIQYADFAVWQRTRPAEEVESDLAYWQHQLAGAPPLLQLPGDPAPPGQLDRSAGAIASVELGPALSARIRTFAGAAGGTPFMVVLAGFTTLLGRLGGTEDVVVGAPVAGRQRPELQQLIGYFLNTVALRTDLSGAPTFTELFQRVRSASTDAYAHQDVPFEQVVEAVQPERSTSTSPIYQVLVNHTSTVPLLQRMADLELEFLGLGSPPAKLPLTLYIRDGADGLGLDALYQTAVFSGERMHGMLDQLVHLLDRATADPDVPVSAHSLAPLAGDLLPDPSLALPAETQPDLRALLAEWVETTPTAPSLEWGGQVWSYADLGRRVAGIQACLGEQGALDGSVVAVTGRRSPGLVAAMVAVLVGGGVLLMLDPRLPRLRRQVMLAEGRVAHLVVVGDGDPGVSVEDLSILRVDPATGGAHAETPGRPGDAERDDLDAAYLFFTSGTTGVPKAVRGRHQGLVHFLRWQRGTFGVAAGDRCAQLTGLSFDVVLRDVLLPLVSGAVLCIPAEEELLPAAGLGWLAEHRVTIVHTVPTLADAWLADGQGSPHLRVTFFAGEPLTGDLTRAWRNATGEGRVVNLYGPTETTLAKCWYEVPVCPPPGVLPVGRPLPGAQALVQRAGGVLCGVGEVGEIVLRTPYRTHVRAGRQEMSRWSANPATKDVGDLLYATGDLGRYRADGSLDILGRTDRQVKIRGVRVETDEVAAVVSRHPAVSQAVVAAAADPAGHPMLVAYLVAPGRTLATETQVRGYLGKRLPAAMVPGVLVFVDDIPVTANGKTDWRALPPAVAPAAASASETFLAPRTEVERVIAQIWSSLLNRERIGVHDDFFALGGHSLLAMQVVSRVASALGVALPLHVLFESPTVAGIAVAVEDRRTAPATTQGQDDSAPIGRAERADAS